MIAGLTLAVLVLLAGTLSWTGRTGAALVIVASVAWELVNHPMEGRTLLVLSSEHGITAGDLAGVAGVAVGVLRLVVLGARPRTERGRRNL